MPDGTMANVGLATIATKSVAGRVRRTSTSEPVAVNPTEAGSGLWPWAYARAPSTFAISETSGEGWAGFRMRSQLRTTSFDVNAERVGTVGVGAMWEMVRWPPA